LRLTEILDLADHGPDTFVGTGPQYPWGGLYGGQIVAQALRAAAATVDPAFVPHSLRAYFIRPGDHNDPVRYEVDRTRNGKSFCTRRVIARQAIGAILNLEASFHRGEESVSFQTYDMGEVPGADDLELGASPFVGSFERRFVPGTDAQGRVRGWFRAHGDLGDDPVVQACALAYISDDLPTDAVIRAHPLGQRTREEIHEGVFSASLDHTIWFHRPLRADEWHLQDFTCHGFTDGRGLAIGHVYRADGTHTATIAQEVLLREIRPGSERH
jgi:acyl-CoA thioesterase-2